MKLYATIYLFYATFTALLQILISFYAIFIALLQILVSLYAIFTALLQILVSLCAIFMALLQILVSLYAIFMALLQILVNLQTIFIFDLKKIKYIKTPPPLTLVLPAPHGLRRFSVLLTRGYFGSYIIKSGRYRKSLRFRV